MRSFLLTWNPRSWEWTDLPADLQKSRSGQPVDLNWRCNNKSPVPGDRVFLLRQGVEPRGIMGSGQVRHGTYRREPDGPRLVDVQMPVLLDPLRDGVLPISALQDGALAGVHWGTQSSGISIPEDAATELQGKWQSFLKSLGRALRSTDWLENVIFPDEIDKPDLLEGASQAVVVNRYERDRKARELCIAHYGARCAVCDLSFDERYGKAMTGFIHVHHLTPLSQIRETYCVDPIKDLRTICPNCHAVVHSRSPTMSIEEARALIGGRPGVR